MGHVFGIGTLWGSNANKLTDRSGGKCRYKVDSAASREYQSLSGCATARIPVENDGGRGTACSHWDEDCLMGELMTGYASGGLEMSRMTIAGLEDLGYEVDYSKANTFSADQLNSACRCNGARNVQFLDSGRDRMVDNNKSHLTSSGWTKFLNSIFTSDQRDHPKRRRQRRRLSATGYNVALEYGRSQLRARSAKAIISNSTIVGGNFYISVLYMEDDEVYSIQVAPESNIFNHDN